MFAIACKRRGPREGRRRLARRRLARRRLARHQRHHPPWPVREAGFRSSGWGFGSCREKKNSTPHFPCKHPSTGAPLTMLQALPALSHAHAFLLVTSAVVFLLEFALALATAYYLNPQLSREVLCRAPAEALTRRRPRLLAGDGAEGERQAAAPRGRGHAVGGHVHPVHQTVARSGEAGDARGGQAEGALSARHDARRAHGQLKPGAEPRLGVHSRGQPVCD
jgi:hypothetical protein